MRQTLFSSIFSQSHKKKNLEQHKTKLFEVPKFFQKMRETGKLAKNLFDLLWTKDDRWSKN